MKRNKLLLNLLLLTAVLSSTQGQSIRKRATILTRDGQELEGWISVLRIDKTPDKLIFRLDSAAKDYQVYTPADLIRFDIHGYESYVSAPVKEHRHSRTACSCEYQSKKRNDKRPSSIFLQKIVEGSIVSLYEYRDEDNRYFVQEKDGGLYELMEDSLAFEISGQPWREIGYKQYLLSVSTRYDVYRQVSNLISKAEFSAYDIGTILTAVNAKKGHIEYEYKYGNSGFPNTNLYVGGGVGYYIPSEFPPEYSDVGFTKMPNRFVPRITVGIEHNLAVARNTFYIRAEINYKTCRFIGNINSKDDHPYKSDFTYQHHTLGIGVMLCGYFVKRENMSMYLGGLLEKKIYWSGKNEYRENSGNYPSGYTFEKFKRDPEEAFTLHAYVGMRFRNHWELNYSIPFITRDIYMNKFYTGSTGFIGLAYHIYGKRL